MEGIYLVHTREFRTQEMNVYKVGRTSQGIEKRLKSYEKGTQVILWEPCKNSVLMEKKIIKHLKNEFIQMKNYGDEYFMGKRKDIEDLIKLCLFGSPKTPKTVYELEDSEDSEIYSDPLSEIDESSENESSDVEEVVQVKRKTPTERPGELKKKFGKMLLRFSEKNLPLKGGKSAPYWNAGIQLLKIMMGGQIQKRTYVMMGEEAFGEKYGPSLTGKKIALKIAKNIAGGLYDTYQLKKAIKVSDWD